MDAIKLKENQETFDKFVIEESEGHKNIIGYDHKVSAIDELTKILNEAHTIIKSYLNYWSTTDCIQDTISWYRSNIYSDCENFVNKLLKYRMHKTHK